MTNKAKAWWIFCFWVWKQIFNKDLFDHKHRAGYYQWLSTTAANFGSNIWTKLAEVSSCVDFPSQFSDSCPSSSSSMCQSLGARFWQELTHLLSRSNFSEFPHHEIIQLTASVIAINHFRHLHQKELSTGIACMNWFSSSFGLLLVKRVVRLNVYLWNALRLMG